MTAAHLKSARWLIAIAALVITAVGWWMIAGGGGPPAPIDDRLDPAGLDPVDEGPTDPGPTPTEADAARVTIVVHPRARLLPPVEVAAWTSRSDAPAGLPLAFVAGPGAAGGPAHGRHLVAVDLLDGRRALRVVDLPATGKPVEIEILPEWVIVGRVLAEGGRALAGARVSGGVLDADGSLRWTITDAEGKFALDGVPNGGGLSIVARADGMASHWRVIDALEPAATIDFLLEPAHEVVVELITPIDRPGLGRAWPVPLSGSTALRHYPFFLAALEGGVVLDDVGRGRVRDLPEIGEVGFVVTHPLAVRSEVGRARRGVASVEVELGAADGSVTAGVVHGPDGVPRAGVSVEWTADRGSLRFTDAVLAPAAYRAHGTAIVTEADGSFVWSARGPGLVRIGSVADWRLEFASGTTADRPWVLPATGAGTGPAVLAVEFDTRPLLARFGDAPFAAVAPGQAVEIELGEPVCCDIELRIEAADGADQVQWIRDVAVRGRTVLAAERD